MPAAVADVTTYKRNDKVVAARAMPGIPEGTRGVVKMVAGFDWIRYWVFFENGVSRGSIDGSKLAPADRWEEIKAQREAAGDEPAGGGEAGPAPDGGGGDAPAAAGGGYLWNGVLVPQHLLDRSKKRREALGLG